jgi:hypothetical protein
LTSRRYAAHFLREVAKSAVSIGRCRVSLKGRGQHSVSGAILAAP